MTPKVSFDHIISYLEGLGDKHIDINKSFRWNRLQIQGAIRGENKESLMLIDAPEFNSEGTQVNVHVIDCAITILGKKDVSNPNLEDDSKQNEIINHCANICFEVGARIQTDSYDSSDNTLKWLYGNVIKNSFSYSKVGPIFTNMYYGYRLEFQIKSPEVYKVDPAKWSDLSV